MRKYILGILSLTVALSASPASAMPWQVPGSWYAQMDWLHSIWTDHQPCNAHKDYFCKGPVGIF